MPSTAANGRLGVGVQRARGLSSTSRSGSPASARARATRWRSPPDSVAPAGPTSRSRPSGQRASSGPRPTPARRRGRRASSRTLRSQEADVVGDRARQQAQAPARPTRCGSCQSAGTMSSSAPPSTSTAPVVRGEQAEQDRGERRLARPRAADDPDPLAAGDDEADRGERRFVGARVGEAHVAHLDPLHARAGAGSGGQQRRQARSRSSTRRRLSSRSCMRRAAGQAPARARASGARGPSMLRAAGVRCSCSSRRRRARR